MASNVLQCPICGSFSISLKLFVSHLRLVHSSDPSFHIMCGIDDCREVFRAFSAFNSHVYRHHRAALGISVEQSVLPSITAQPELSPHTYIDELCNASAIPQPGPLPRGPTIGSSHCSTSTATPTDDDIATAATFLLQLREGRQISQAAISDVITGCKTLCKRVADN